MIPGVEKTTWGGRREGRDLDGLHQHRQEVDRRGAAPKLKLHLTPYFTPGRRPRSASPPTDARAYTAKRKADTIVTRQAQRDENGQIVAEEVRRPVSPAEINRELQLLKRTLNLARNDGKLASVPKIELLREDNARRGFFDREQVASVCRHLPAEIAAVVQFAFATGWRIASEVLPLEWRNVDFAAGEVRLDAGTTKNREGRVFHMTTELRKLLKGRHVDHEVLKKAGQVEPWVFWRMVAERRGAAKKPKPIVRFNKVWKSACLAAGLPGRIPHDLRRSAVRTFVRSGISEHTAMALSGHKTSSVFRRYDIISSDDLRDAARKLDAGSGQRKKA